MGTWRGGLMPLVINVYAGLWGIAGKTLCQTGDYSVRLMRHVTCIVRQRQLRLYVHVARLSEVDPAHRDVSVRDNPEWRRPRGRPRNSWVEQVDRSCRKVLGLGRGPVWRLARRDPRAWRRRVGEATHPPRMPPLIDWLIDITDTEVSSFVIPSLWGNEMCVRGLAGLITQCGRHYKEGRKKKKPQEILGIRLDYIKVRTYCKDRKTIKKTVDYRRIYRRKRNK